MECSNCQGDMIVNFGQRKDTKEVVIIGHCPYCGRQDFQTFDREKHQVDLLKAMKREEEYEKPMKRWMSRRYGCLEGMDVSKVEGNGTCPTK